MPIQNMSDKEVLLYTINGTAHHFAAIFHKDYSNSIDVYSRDSPVFMEVNDEYIDLHIRIENYPDRLLRFKVEELEPKHITGEKDALEDAMFREG